MILCCRNSDINEYIRGFGFIKTDNDESDKILSKLKDLMWIGPRHLLEEMSEFRQIIPYCVLSNSEGKVLSYERNNKTGEKRLHGFKSIGFGGHVNGIDVIRRSDVLEITEDLDYCIDRELNEELKLIKSDSRDYNITDFIHDQYCVGFIKLCETLVDSVHIGFVYELRVIYSDNFKIKPVKSEGISNLEWLTLDQLKQNIDQYENWSKEVINNL